MLSFLLNQLTALKFQAYASLLLTALAISLNIYCYYLALLLGHEQKIKIGQNWTHQSHQPPTVRVHPSRKTRRTRRRQSWAHCHRRLRELTRPPIRFPWVPRHAAWRRMAALQQQQESPQATRHSAAILLLWTPHSRPPTAIRRTPTAAWATTAAWVSRAWACARLAAGAAVRREAAAASTCPWTRSSTGSTTPGELAYEFRNLFWVERICSSLSVWQNDLWPKINVKKRHYTYLPH